MRLFDVFFVWIRRASRYRLFWLGGPLAFYSWTLTGPFMADDLHLLLKSERYLRGESQSLELYRFAKTDEDWNTLRHRGICPWWLPETGRLDFFRPVSEWVFYAGVHLFGRGPIGHRMISLALFGCVLGAVHWMFALASEDRVRAGVATFFFGISQTVAPPVTWICNRQDLLVVLGAALAGGAYWSASRSPKLWWLVIAVSGCLFALLSKEVAVSLCAVLIGHELVTRVSRDTRWTRPRPAIIAGFIGGLTLCYLFYYRYSRPWVFDTSGADGGQSQLGSNWPFSILLYSAVWTIGFPIDVLLMATNAQKVAVAALGSVMTVVAVRYILKCRRDDRAVAFFALWAVAFMLPSLRASTASTRSLCEATVGWTYLLAGLIVPTREEDVVIPRPLRHWFYAANGVVSLGCSIGTVLFMTRTEERAQTEMRQMVANCVPPLADGHALIAAQSSNSAENICAGDRLEFLMGLHDVAFTYLLPPGIEAVTHVEDTHTLVMRATDKSLMGSPIQALSLPHHFKPRVGHMFQLREFSVEIAQVRDDDFVEALRIHFREPLLSPHIHFHPPKFAAVAKADEGRRIAQIGGS